MILSEQKTVIKHINQLAYVKALPLLCNSKESPRILTVGVCQFALKLIIIMKLQKGKQCRIYGEIDNVRVVRVTGDNVIVRGKNGQCRAVSAKNLRTPISKKFRWLACVIDFLTVKI